MNRDPADLVIQKLGSRLHEIREILEYDAFELQETDLEPRYAQGTMRRLRALGALEIDKRIRENGARRCRYRWAMGVPERLREYLDSLDTLPCGHHYHIHNPRDSPDGVFGCKFCGEPVDRETLTHIRS